MSDGVDRQSDAVLHSDLAHELTDVRFNGTLLNTERVADFPVRSARDQQFQHFTFTVTDLFFALRVGPGEEMR